MGGQCRASTRRQASLDLNSSSSALSAMRRWKWAGSRSARGVTRRRESAGADSSRPPCLEECAPPSAPGLRAPAPSPVFSRPFFRARERPSHLPTMSCFAPRIRSWHLWLTTEKTLNEYSCIVRAQKWMDGINHYESWRPPLASFRERPCLSWTGTRVIYVTRGAVRRGGNR